MHLLVEQALLRWIRLQRLLSAGGRLPLPQLRPLPQLHLPQLRSLPGRLLRRLQWIQTLLRIRLHPQKQEQENADSENVDDGSGKELEDDAEEELAKLSDGE